MEYPISNFLFIVTYLHAAIYAIIKCLYTHNLCTSYVCTTSLMNTKKIMWFYFIISIIKVSLCCKKWCSRRKNRDLNARTTISNACTHQTSSDTLEIHLIVYFKRKLSIERNGSSMEHFERSKSLSLCCDVVGVLSHNLLQKNSFPENRLSAF